MVLWFCYFASQGSLFLSNCYVTQLCPTLWDPIDCSTPGFPVLHYLLEFAQVHVHWINDAIQPSHPLLLTSPPAFKFSQYQVFSNELALCIRWPKYWSFSFSISPSSEYSGLISFMMDWFDLFAVQGSLKSLLQHLSLKASALQCSAFFMVQLSHLYITTEKTIALTTWTFAGKVKSLLFNTLSRFVIAFLPRSKCLSVSCLPSRNSLVRKQIFHATPGVEVQMQTLKEERIYLLHSLQDFKSFPKSHKAGSLQVLENGKMELGVGRTVKARLWNWRWTQDLNTFPVRFISWQTAYWFRVLLLVFAFKLWCMHITTMHRDFPGSPVVKSPPCNAGDTGSIPGQGIKNPTAAEQLSLRTTTRESVDHN